MFVVVTVELYWPYSVYWITELWPMGTPIILDLRILSYFVFYYSNLNISRDFRNCGIAARVSFNTMVFLTRERVHYYIIIYYFVGHQEVLICTEHPIFYLYLHIRVVLRCTRGDPQVRLLYKSIGMIWLSKQNRKFEMTYDIESVRLCTTHFQEQYLRF
jgi:hypothetical protein